MNMSLLRWFLLIGLIAGMAQTAFAEEDSGARPVKVPDVKDLMSVMDKATSDAGQGQEWSTPVKLVIVFTGLALLPTILVMTTSFTRIVIVLSFLRRALGTQSIPPNIALMGLALFLTLFTMAPTFSAINETSIQPYLSDQIDFSTATNHAAE